MSGIPVHPAADIFPMEESTISSLAEDIRKHGQQVPLDIWKGQLLDGRRRLRACEIAGISPRMRDVETDDPVSYVLSTNLHRRQLTPSQKAMVAAKAREFYDQQAKERQRAAGGDHKKKPLPENLPEAVPTDARDAAGKAVGVSGRTVDYATKVLTQGEPELIAAVEEGRMAVSTAAILSSEPPEKQKEEATRPHRNRKYKPGVGGGESTSDDSDKGTQEEPPPGVSRGFGIERAHEAIACLKRIPKNDMLRKRGLQIVSDWIRHNK